MLYEGAWTVSTGVMQCNLSQRAAVTAFPVPTFRPLTSNSVLALDLMPNGSPTESTNNGFAWLDVCDADVYASNSPELNSARVGITSYGADFGSRAFNGASLLNINDHADLRLRRHCNDVARQLSDRQPDRIGARDAAHRDDGAHRRAGADSADDR